MPMTVEAVRGQKLYLVVVDALRREIETGRFAEAQLLPAERVLCELLDVSRTTLRKAIADLVTEGVLFHRHGAGTFIHRARPRVDQPSSRLTSFTEDMRLRGLEASSRELERGVFLPTPEEAMMLGVGPNERVFRLGRLRLADGSPMAIERAAVPLRYLPEWDTVGASLYEALSARGFKPTRGLQRLRATLVSDLDAELLGVARNSPALYIQRIAYLADGSCIEFTKSLYRADAYDFVSELALSPPVRKGAPMTTHMFEEIGEAGDAVARQLGDNAELLAGLGRRLRALDPPLVTTIARGSSDCCALYLKYLVEIVAHVPCASIGPSIATLYRAPMRLQGAVSVAISQSGRSPDIVEMQRAVRRGGALAIALVNELDSPLAQEAEALLPLCAGPERSIAATKSMIAGLVAGASLVATWREDRPLANAIAGLPDILRGQTAPPPAAMLEQLASARSVFVLGRGATLAIAAEAALKLKETCAIHAEAYSAAEVLHGPAELVISGFPVIAFVPSDAAREGMLTTLALLAEAGATVIAIETGGSDDAHRLAVAKVRATLLEPVVMIHRFYRLAEALARRLGRDPDRPRNLRKVTETV